MPDRPAPLDMPAPASPSDRVSTSPCTTAAAAEHRAHVRSLRRVRTAQDAAAAQRIGTKFMNALNGVE